MLFTRAYILVESMCLLLFSTRVSAFQSMQPKTCETTARFQLIYLNLFEDPKGLLHRYGIAIFEMLNASDCEWWQRSRWYAVVVRTFSDTRSYISKMTHIRSQWITFSNQTELVNGVYFDFKFNDSFSMQWLKSLHEHTNAWHKKLVYFGNNNE